MPSKLNKVHKQITKKKGSKINSLHENSRDALRLRKASARDDRVARVNAVKQRANGRWVERIEFLREQLPETLDPVSTAVTQQMIAAYLARHNSEISDLKAERRSGRPASTRQVLLEQMIDADVKEYESGFWLPNLADEETLSKLNEWHGDWSSLAYLRYIRVDAAGRVKESQFPPRGAS